MGDEKATILGVRCVGETEKAIKVQSIEFTGWVPQKAVHDDSEVFHIHHAGKLVLKGWFAESLGIELD